MIRSFKSRNLRRFYLKGDRSRIGASMADRIGRLLDFLDVAETPEHMNMPGNDFHKMSGGDRYSVHVNGNWYITFEWDGSEAIRVDLKDYH